MDGSPKSNTSVVDFVSTGKTMFLPVCAEKAQNAVFQSILNMKQTTRLQYFSHPVIMFHIMDGKKTCAFK